MDAALETMFAFRQTRDPEITALDDASLGHVDVLKTTAAFRNDFLPTIESLYKPATELPYFSKGVRLPALISHNNSRSLFDRERIGLEVPARIRTSIRCLWNEVLESSCESKRSKRDVLA